MLDHDLRGTQYMLRTSPPQAGDFITSTMGISKQQQSQQQQQQQQQHHQQHFQQQQNHLAHHQQHFVQQQHQHHSQEYHQSMKRPPYQNHFVFNPAFPTPISMSATSASNNTVYSEDDFEDVDDDDISDIDEEELRLSYEHYRHSLRKQPDVTSQLLQFADMVSADIKKFFGRSKDQDDSCDVYEDKWATTKSGRELYYADLLRIAQGDSEPVNKTTKKCVPSSSSSSSSPSTSLSPRHELDNRSRFTGKRDVSLGMGPLKELFEYGLQQFLLDKKRRSSCSNSRTKVSTLAAVGSKSNKERAQLVPMQDRNFPESFWREPTAMGLVNNVEGTRPEINQHNMLTSSKLPDFSDLVESWQGGAEGVTSVGQERSGRMDIPMDHHRL